MFVCLRLTDVVSTRKDVGLDLFFPRELINSMKVSTPTPTTQPHATLSSAQLITSLPPPALRQPKQLRRLIQQTFQGYSTLRQDECMSRFFSTLSQCYTFTQESFECQLVVRRRVVWVEWRVVVLGYTGTNLSNVSCPSCPPQHGWNLKIHLVIGAEGISQQTDNSSVSDFGFHLLYFLPPPPPQTKKEKWVKTKTTHV